MHHAVSALAALIMLCSALMPPAARTPVVELDTDSLGGYTGDYILIYNPDQTPSSSMQTGSMQGMIRTDPEPPPHPNRPSLLDVDAEVKKHMRLFDPPVGPEPGETEYTVGSVRSFYVDPFYSPNGELTMNFECLAVGEHCYVWSVAEGHPNGFALQEIDPDLAESMAEEFDSKYQDMQSAFGGESDYSWYSASKLNLLCYNIEDDWQFTGGSFVGGYFSADTCRLSHAPVINVDTYPTIWQVGGAPSFDIAKRVLVHEYAHLLTYVQTGGTEDWLEEVIASAAEEVCYPGSCIVPRIPQYSSMNGKTMYEWSGLDPDTAALYSRGALFGQYLYTRFGNEIFASITGYIADGNSPVTAVYFATNRVLSDLVLEFYLAVLINDKGVLDGIYGFDTQPGYDPLLYGIEDPYSMLRPDYFTGPSCTIWGGGAIVVRTKFGVYYPPSGATKGLKYVGVKFTYPSYTVNFYGFEGQLLSSLTVTEGACAEPPRAPEVEGHTFIKWSKDVNGIYADTDIYALYALNERLLYCDANCSGIIGFEDVSFICLCLHGVCAPDNAFYFNADVDMDGRVLLSDASALYLLLVGTSATG